MNVLAVAAHPDDEVLGCGATLARLAREGHAVFVAILAEGATSRARERGDVPAAAVDALAASARAAAGVLGVQEVVLAGFPDNRLDTVALLDVARIVEDLVSRFEPQVVLTHHSGDLNVDHRRAFEAVAVATRPMAGTPVREVLQFEVPSSTEWAFGAVAQPFRAEVLYDVAATLDAKVEAMRCYASEMRPFPHPRSEENVRAAATHWGAAAGMDAAEAFQPMRILR